jgi:hypothetical protein
LILKLIDKNQVPEVDGLKLEISEEAVAWRQCRYQDENLGDPCGSGWSVFIRADPCPIEAKIFGL